VKTSLCYQNFTSPSFGVISYFLKPKKHIPRKNIHETIIKSNYSINIFGLNIRNLRFLRHVQYDFFFFLIACAPKNTTQRDSFDLVWNTVNTTFPYEDFQTLDWNSVYKELKPKADKAQSSTELRPILRDMLSRLQLSHYSIIAQEQYTPAQQPDRTEHPLQTDHVALNNQKMLGWNGIEGRWIEQQLIVTKVSSPAKELGVQTGWIITDVSRRSTAEFVDTLHSSQHQKSLDIGLFIQFHSYNLVNTTKNFGFLDHNDQPRSLDLPYQTGEGVIAELANYPPVLVRFSHEQREDNIDIIAFNSFMMPIRPRIIDAFQKIAQTQPKGLIIDLRGNLGGLIGLGSGLAGHIFSESGKSLGAQITRSGTMFFQIKPQSRRVRYDGPVAILIDELSVSTSEILAGGLQELKRARLFGQKTPGKALPSIITQLPNGDRFQYVISDLKTPSGKRYEGEGVIPDVIISPSRKDYLEKHDPTLEAACSWILKQNSFQKDQP